MCCRNHIREPAWLICLCGYICMPSFPYACQNWLSMHQKQMCPSIAAMRLPECPLKMNRFLSHHKSVHTWGACLSLIAYFCSGIVIKFFELNSIIPRRNTCNIAKPTSDPNNSSPSFLFIIFHIIHLFDIPTPSLFSFFLL